MPNKFFISSILFLSIFSAEKVFAQNCSAPFEMVTKLYQPAPGSYTVWDSLYGDEQKDEEFISALNDGEEIIAVGEVRQLQGAHPEMVFVKFDRRGRKLWEKSHSINGLRNIVKMLPNGDDGYLVASNNQELQGHNFVWLGFFDKKGKLLRQNFIKDKKTNLYANDIILSSDGNGWALAITSEYKFGDDKNRDIRKNATVYLLDKNGNVKFNRTYILGVNNEISGLSVAKLSSENVGYIATGYFENSNNKKIGWVLRLAQDSSYIWQKEFSRGESANMKISSSYKNGSILVAGDVKAVNSGAGAALLMALNGGDGELLWQRFYYGESGHHNYTAKGLYIDDGVASLMMMAKSSALPPASDIEQKLDDGNLSMPEFMSYAHVLTVNSRGVTISGDSYYMGKGVSISQMVRGNSGRRVMAGYALVKSDNIQAIDEGKPLDIVPLKEKGYIDLPDIELSQKAKKGLAMLKSKVASHEEEGIVFTDKLAKPKNKESKITRDAWVVVGDAPDKYNDPCVRNYGVPK